MFFAMISWKMICNDPVAGLGFMLVILLPIAIIPLLASGRNSEGGLFTKMYDYFFAPREYPWVRGWGRKMWLLRKKKGEKLSWEA